MKKCANCGADLVRRHQAKFCSNKCQFLYQHKNWIKEWKEGKINGNIGITARNISKHLKNYLGEKFGNRCFECEWNKKHPVTGVVPLEIDHVDGNAENNSESNLRLLCPNCHALTPFYKNLNRGKGRKWRMDKYIKNKDAKNLSPV
jgi:nitrate reductase cytochrome c-type subunit